MAQFTVADIPGAFARGQQFRQQQELRPLEIAIAQQNIEKGQQGIERGQQGLQFAKTQQRALEQQIDQRTDQQKINHYSILPCALTLLVMRK